MPGNVLLKESPNPLANPPYRPDNLTSAASNNNRVSSVTTEPRLERGQPLQNRRSVSSFSVEGCAPNNYLVDCFLPPRLEQEYAIPIKKSYDEIPAEKKQFITFPSYNTLINNLFQYLDDIDKSIILAKLLADTSNSSEIYQSQVKQPFLLYNTDEQDEQNVITLINTEYEEMGINSAKGITFDAYFLAAYQLLEDAMIPEKNAFAMLENIVTESNNIGEFHHLLSTDYNIITQKHQAIFNEACHNLDFENLFITSSILQKQIKLLCRIPMMYSEACASVVEIVKQSEDIENFHTLLDNLHEKLTTLDKTLDNLPEKQLTTLDNLPEELTTTKVTSPDYCCSSMVSFGLTCWFNSTCKYVINHINADLILKSIDNVIAKCDATIAENQYKKLILETLKILFTDLKHNKEIEIQIRDFFIAIYNYGKSIPPSDDAKKPIENIFDLIKRAFDNDPDNPDFRNIPTTAADEFCELLLELLEIHDNTDTLIPENYRDFTFSVTDLLTMKIHLPKGLGFRIISDVTNDEVYVYRDSETTPAKDACLISYFIELLDRAENLTISQPELLQIKETASQVKNKKREQCSYTVEHGETYYAEDIEEFSRITVRVSGYIYEDGIPQIDKDKAITNVKLFFPSFDKEITDKTTKIKYKVSFKANSILMRGGDGPGGHYFTLCVKDNMLFMQNDTVNELLENSILYDIDTYQKASYLDYFRKLSIKEQLLTYMKTKGVYPINIGFEVIDKVKIK